MKVWKKSDTRKSKQKQKKYSNNVSSFYCCHFSLQEANQEIMKVVCAGLFQTGTESLAIALKILGYKLYSYDHHLSLHLEPWVAALKGSKDQLNFSAMYQGT